MDTLCRCSMNACCAICLQREARRQKLQRLIAVIALAVVIVALAFSAAIAG